MRLVSMLSGDQSLTIGIMSLRSESLFAKEIALVCSHTTHLVTAVTTEVLATVPYGER